MGRVKALGALWVALKQKGKVGKRSLILRGSRDSPPLGGGWKVSMGLGTDRVTLNINPPGDTSRRYICRYIPRWESRYVP